MKKFIFTACLSLFAMLAKAQTAETGPPPSVEELKVTNPNRDKLNEIMPKFPGGMEGFKKFLKENFKLPQNSSEIHGLVVATFYVEINGTLTGITITKGLTPDIDKESIRVMGLSPKWTPYIKDGKPARVKYSVPIRIPFD